MFHMTNMAMMNAYLLLCRSQMLQKEAIIMQEQRMKNLPRLHENLKLHNHFTFRTDVVLALVQEGNRDRTFRNPCVRVLALAPERHFSECHFQEEIIPTKEGAKNYCRCNECYTDKGGSTPNINVARAKNFCACGHALRCTTRKASHMRMQSRHGMSKLLIRRCARMMQTWGDVWMRPTSM